jgi:hypothetical protein
MLPISGRIHTGGDFFNQAVSIMHSFRQEATMKSAIQLLLLFWTAVIVLATSRLYAQNSLPRDTNGWTIFTPSTDTRLIYVSSTNGNDATAQFYTPSDAAISSDPFLPSGAIKPYKTIAEAAKNARNDSPDWILLKRGDTWFESLPLRSGKSKTEPYLASYYGSAKERPLLKTGSKAGFSQCCKNHHYIAVSGVAFYAHTRDFNSPDFASQDGASGFNFFTGDTYTGTGVLVEGCSFRFYTGNVVQGGGTINDVVIRRNLILDNYSATGHSQGMYTKNVNIILEENIFDHNGWFKQQIGSGQEKDSGQATMYNHNTYFCNAQSATFQGNMFLRASSMGNKWTANDGIASAKNITIENNLYVEGEIGIGIGGNVSEPPHRFKNVIIKNNVMTDIGRAQPTNRTLGWYLDINDWDIGTVSGNLFIHNTSTVVKNVYAINLDGETRDVTIENNIIHGLNSNSRMVSLTDGSTKQNIVFKSNAVQCGDYEVTLIDAKASLNNYLFSNNTYFSGRTQDEWFLNAGTRTGFAGWQSAAGETGSEAKQISYSDPTRTVETYHASLGKEATLAAFIAEARKQSKFNWRTEYTAAAVNEWIRAGFGMASARQPAFDPHIGNRKRSGRSEVTAVYTINGKYIGNIRRDARQRNTLPCAVYLLQCGKSKKAHRMIFGN